MSLGRALLARFTVNANIYTFFFTDNVHKLCLSCNVLGYPINLVHNHNLYLRIYLMQVLENYQTMNMEKNSEANESLDPGLKV